MFRQYPLKHNMPVWEQNQSGLKLSDKFLYCHFFKVIPVFQSLFYPCHSNYLLMDKLFEKLNNSSTEYIYIPVGVVNFSEKRALIDYYIVYKPLKVLIFCSYMSQRIDVLVDGQYGINKEYADSVDKFAFDLIEGCYQKKENNIPYMNILIRDQNGFSTERKQLIPMKDFSIDDNYNKDFSEINDIIIKGLEKEGGKGIVLLHGKPGTGKSTYLKYLCQSIKKKSVIFIPPNIAAQLSEPHFLGFLTRCQDSILVIEDAEDLIQSRNKVRSSAVSNILNISDGLLSDILRISIVATFNAEISDIDSALLRKGRLIAKYHFDKLSADKCNALFEKNGHGYRTTQPMPLTDVYNPEDKAFGNVERPRIGFVA